MYIIRTDIFEYILSILKLIKTTSMMKIVTLVKGNIQKSTLHFLQFWMCYQIIKIKQKIYSKVYFPFPVKRLLTLRF